jgi:hypothetical protein
MLSTWQKAVTENFSVVVPFVTFVLGWFGARLSMTKKERKDFEQKQFENGRDLMLAQHGKFQEFAAALAKYVNKEGEPTFSDFLEIATVGETFLYQQRVTSDAILADKVDSQSRENTLVPSIVETLQKTLPNYYKVLQSIAKKRGFEYDGKLKRENYESLYIVVEKYGRQLPSPNERDRTS